MREHFDALSQNIAAGYVDVLEADAIAEIEAAIAIDRALVRTSSKQR